MKQLAVDAIVDNIPSGSKYSHGGFASRQVGQQYKCLGVSISASTYPAALQLDAKEPRPQPGIGGTNNMIRYITNNSTATAHVTIYLIKMENIPLDPITYLICFTHSE